MCAFDVARGRGGGGGLLVNGYRGVCVGSWVGEMGEKSGWVWGNRCIMWE